MTTFGNRIGILGASFKDISMAYRLNGDMSGVKNMFAKTNTHMITEMDYAMLQNFNAEVAKGTPIVQAMGQTMVGASSGARTLAQGAGQAGVDLSTVTIAANTSRIAMIGMRVAAMALNMVLSMGLAVAIQTVISGLSYLINYEEKQAEAAREAAREAREHASALRDTSNAASQESSSLDDLIAKYQQLKSAGELDTESRLEVQNIQSEITSLVGSQADNLDLVNGKLDEQLEKLYNIKDFYTEESINAYRDSITSTANAAKKTTQEVAWDLTGISQNHRDEIEKIVDELEKDPVINQRGNSGFKFDGDTLTLQNSIWKRNALIDPVLEYLKTNNLQTTELYNNLIAAKNEIENGENGTNIIQGEVRNLINALIDKGDYDKTIVRSMSDYTNLREKRIRIKKKIFN